jgi:hypothetical protein
VYGEWYGDGEGYREAFDGGGAGDPRRRHGNGGRLPSNGDRGPDEGHADQSDPDPLWGTGVTIIDDDVHVIVRRREDLVSEGASARGSGSADDSVLAER